MKFHIFPGWDQGLLGVCTGEERHLVVPADLAYGERPADLAYGERGAGEVIPPGATLLFDIVVVSVEKAKSQAAKDAELAAIAAKKAAEDEELKLQQELEAQQQQEEEERLNQEQELVKQEQEAARAAEAAKLAAEEEKRLQEELRAKQEAEEELKKQQQQKEKEKKETTQKQAQPTEEYEYEYVDEAGACEEGELQSQVVKASPGRCSRKAQKGDKLSMHYTGRLLDGRKFDSSKDRNKPFDFTPGVGQVIQGWDDGVIGMCVRESRKLTIPPGMAYGAEGVGNVIPPCATLTFEVDLLDIA